MSFVKIDHVYHETFFKVMTALLKSLYCGMEYIILILVGLTVVYFIHVRLFRLNSCVQVVQFKGESIY